jgi:hypothetical protein
MTPGPKIFSERIAWIQGRSAWRNAMYIVACLSLVGMVRRSWLTSHIWMVRASLRWLFPCLEMHSASRDRITIRLSYRCCLLFPWTIVCYRGLCLSYQHTVHTSVHLISCDYILPTTGHLRIHVPQLAKSARKRRKKGIEDSAGRIFGLGTVDA